MDLSFNEVDRTMYDQIMDSLSAGMDLQTFLLFFGYQRSGSSMVGSLIDAHPDAAIANELDAIKAYQNGDTRERLFTKLVAVSTAYKLIGPCQAGSWSKMAIACQSSPIMTN